MKIIKNLFYKFVPDRFVLRRGYDKNTIYLTFDDGPYNDFTRLIFEGLCEQEILATFFVNGDSIKNYPDLLTKIHQKGNLIGNHSFSHFRPSHLGLSETIEEIGKTNSIIESIIHMPCRIYRPPYGLLTLPQIIYTVCNRMTIVMWSYDSMDSFVSKYEEIEVTLKNIKGGDILLFHNDSEITAKNILNIINEIKKRGFHFGLVSERYGRK
jgi:peptidoglycan-N-acetylglucosamine deacetylase